MNKDFSTTNIEDDDFLPNTKESDYKNLIIRLKEIGVRISLLEKITLR